MAGGWIETAFDLLQLPITEGDIATRLLATGCPRVVAEKLVAFLPLACGRALLENSGVTFSDMYRGMSEDGTVGESQSLSADREWNTVEAFVIDQRIVQPEAVRVVGRRSAEVDASNKAILKGSKLANLVFSDPIFLFVAPHAAPTIEQRKTGAPWWAFWRRN